MAYGVEIAKSAEAELEELYLWVVARAPQQGAKWFNSLERAVLCLDQHPKRCPVAPESIDPDHPVRVLSDQHRHDYEDAPSLLVGGESDALVLSAADVTAAVTTVTAIDALSRNGTQL